MTDPEQVVVEEREAEATSPSSAPEEIASAFTWEALRFAVYGLARLVNRDPEEEITVSDQLREAEEAFVNVVTALKTAQQVIAAEVEQISSEQGEENPR